MHALGIALTLPHILESDERVLDVSLGVGNAGRELDLDPDRRTAEFKFISWRGGTEAVRQNQLFKDFYLFAEAESPKRNGLYLTGARHALRFLNGGKSPEKRHKPQQPALGGVSAAIWVLVSAS